MNHNIILLFTLFAIVAAISSLQPSMSSYKTNINKTSNCETSNCKTNIDENIKTANSCFLYENTNRRQTIYMNLINALQKLSHKHRSLGKDCKKDIFIQGTTDNRLKTELDEITNMILSKLNSLAGFSFKRVQYDAITIFTAKDGNKNFVYNVFVYDANEELDIRLSINVIKYIIKCPKKQMKVTCTAVTTPGMTASGVDNTFEIGYPQPEQLLPLPTSIINTSGGPDVLNMDGINIKEITPIRSLYVNEIKIYNTNAVINANNECISPPVCGNIKDTTLSSSVYNGLTTPFQEPACVRNKWIPLHDQPKNIRAYPAGEASEYWNTEGVPLSVTCNSNETGIRSSTTEYPVEPQFWRSNYVIPKHSGPYNDLFSLTRGDVSTDGAAFTN